MPMVRERVIGGLSNDRPGVANDSDYRPDERAARVAHRRLIPIASYPSLVASLIGLLCLLSVFAAAPARAQSTNTWVYMFQCFNATNPTGYWATYEEAAQACAVIENFQVGTCSPSGLAIAGTISRCNFTQNGQIVGADLALTEPATAGYYLTLDPQPKADCGCDKKNNNKVQDPISPANGNVSHEETDIAAQASSPQSAFKRFYNSADDGTTDLGTGWRHSFSRQIIASPLSTEQQQYFYPYPRDSPLYDTPEIACTSGWSQIAAALAEWPGASASYSHGICTLTQGGSVVATLPVRYAFKNPPVPIAEAMSVEVIRDDGQDVHFTLDGSSLSGATGATLRLTLTDSGGYQVIDDEDTIENYNPSGQLLSVTSRTGVTETLSYNANGQLSTVVDSFGHQLTLSYNAQGNLVSVTDPNSLSVAYGYDANNRLSTVTNLDGTSRSYVYENPVFPLELTGIIDESSIRYATWGYDAMGRANSGQEAGGADAASLVYNADGSVTVTDALGAVRTFTFSLIGDQNRVTGISGSKCPTCTESAATTYDAAGFVASRVDYNGNLTCYANDPTRGLELVRVEGFAPGSACPANLASYVATSGTVQRVITTQWSASFREPVLISEPDRTTSFTYDGSGNALTITVTDTSVSPALSRTWVYTYNSYGQVLTLDGPRTDMLDVTTLAYTTCSSGPQCGQIHTLTNALGQVTTFNAYNAYGQPLSITDPNGVVTTLTYDARARLTSRQVGTETTGFAYYPTGLLQTVTLPDQSTLTMTYDGAHRLVKIQDGWGNSVRYTLDALGNRTSESTYDPSNALSRTQSRVYNALSELYQQIGAAGTSAVTTSFGYDANGNQTSINAPLSRDTVSTFDALNRLTQIIDPSGGETSVIYDANDQVVSVNDPAGRMTQYHYDGLGDLLQLSSPATGSTTDAYDSAGNLTASTDARGISSTYSFDALNRLTQAAYGDRTLTYSYDSGTYGRGHLTGAGDANHSMAWAYDALGRVVGQGQTVGAVTQSVGYGYTNGDLTTLVTPSGQTVTYSYMNHRITGIAINGSTLLSGVVYEPFGPPRGWTWANGTVESRLHDADGNPSKFAAVESTTYTLDSAFRITGISNTSNSALSWSYGYDSLDRLTSASNTASSLAYTYDADGNRLTQAGTGGPVYGAASIVNTYNNRGRLSSVSANNVTTVYLYNALGQRIEKSGASATLYFYDEAGHLLGEYTSTGALIEETIWLGDLPVATLQPDPFSGVDIYYIHADPLGTPKMITRATDNAIMWRWDQDPFGSAAPNQNPSSQGTFVYNLRYPGQYFDAETGLSYNYFRDYDPQTGRYIQSDPIGLRAGVNTYAYANGNPISNVDPFGLCVDRDACKKLVRRIQNKMNDFNDAYGKYDPLTDYYGGFRKRYPPYTTKPLGHYNKLLELQQGLNNDIAEYNRLHCDEDDDDGPGFGQVPWQALVDATRIIDIPHPWTSASQTATPSPSNAATDVAAGGLLLLILGAILNPN